MTKLEKIQVAQDKTAKVQLGLEAVQETLDKAEQVAEVEEELEECSGSVLLVVAAVVTVTALAVGTIIIVKKRRSKKEDENEDWPN